jgi:hypothetical protein
MVDFASNRTHSWLALSRHSNRNDYPAAVVLPRAIYDMVDRVTAREDLDGMAAFRRRYHQLDHAYGIATGMHGGQQAAGGLLQRLIGRRPC